MRVAATDEDLIDALAVSPPDNPLVLQREHILRGVAWLRHGIEDPPGDDCRRFARGLPAQDLGLLLHGALDHGPDTDAGQGAALRAHVEVVLHRPGEAQRGDAHRPHLGRAARLQRVWVRQGQDRFAEEVVHQQRRNGPEDDASFGVRSDDERSIAEVLAASCSLVVLDLAALGAGHLLPEVAVVPENLAVFGCPDDHLTPIMGHLHDACIAHLNPLQDNRLLGIAVVVDVDQLLSCRQGEDLPWYSHDLRNLLGVRGQPFQRSATGNVEDDNLTIVCSNEDPPLTRSESERRNVLLDDPVMRLKLDAGQGTPDAEAIFHRRHNLQPGFIEDNGVDGPVCRDAGVAGITVKNHHPPARDDHSIAAEGAQSSWFQRFQFACFLSLAVAGMEALNARQLPHIPEFHHRVHVYAEELKIGLGHGADANDAALMAVEDVDWVGRLVPHVPHCDEVVKAATEKHLVLRTVLQAGKALAVAPEGVRPLQLHNIVELYSCIERGRGESLQKRHPAHRLHRLMVADVEFEGLVWLEGRRGRPHCHPVGDVPGVDPLPKVVGMI
mmetsp:Transcript_35904/g.78633  ORF Transcript_35904/g.78633 Transcript_35904/m.78633 type:complete len:555 (+) Transcript_35904:675-2339(+)